MTSTILVTAPRLAPEGAALLTAAGARVLYLPGGQGAAEVEALLAAEPVDAVISRTMDLTVLERTRAHLQREERIRESNRTGSADPERFNALLRERGLPI